MTKERRSPSRRGLSVKGSLLTPQAPWLSKDSPIPSVWRDLGVFFRYEIPAGLRRRETQWALLALYAGALVMASQVAYTWPWVIPLSLLTMVEWLGVLLGIMIHVVVFHTSFLKCCMKDRSLPVFTSHALALSFSLPVFTVSVLAQSAML